MIREVDFGRFLRRNIWSGYFYTDINRTMKQWRHAKEKIGENGKGAIHHLGQYYFAYINPGNRLFDAGAEFYQLIKDIK